MTVTSPPPLDLGDAVAGEPSASAMDLKWSALHQAASIVAALAALPGDLKAAAGPEFPAMMRAAGGWRLALATQGIDDLAAVMEPGVAALLSIHGRGADPTVAAQALWEEFAAARDALLALAPPPR